MKVFNRLTVLASAIALSLASGSAFAQLTKADCDGIVAAAAAAAAAEDSVFRPAPAVTKMHIACLDKRGRILAFQSDPDAWVGSIDIAKAKAYTAMAFSSDENALSSRGVGCLANGFDDPLFEIGNSNDPGTGNSRIRERGLILFPGGLPLYKNGEMVGGIGVSGDAVVPDENVAVAGAVGFTPAAAITSKALGIVEYTSTAFPDCTP